MKDKRLIWIFLIILLVLIIAGAVLYILKQQTQIYEMTEQWNLEKTELSDEYNNLSLQYEGVRQNIYNDSLIVLVENEQLKVQRLMEELRTVKATNTQRIMELKKELKTLREIMRGYIVQIDSLNNLNRQLSEEKEQVTIKYQQATQTIDQLSQEKNQLHERVSLASKLDASGISVAGLNAKNKTEKKIRKMEQLLINFHINKNITAPTGEKMIYIRIKKPDDDVLVKNRSNVFTYENKEINYSSKRLIEYTGEEVPVAIYWKIEEFLSPGTYRVDIFADGNLIGSQSFRLED
jgi:cell division protein FtsL